MAFWLVHRPWALGLSALGQAAMACFVRTLAQGFDMESLIQHGYGWIVKKHPSCGRLIIYSTRCGAPFSKRFADARAFVCVGEVMPFGS